MIGVIHLWTGESKASVLIVEDDPYLNLAIAETLRSYDFSVEQVYNGLEALQSVRSRQPDVIVCDINMPVMDGYTLPADTGRPAAPAPPSSSHRRTTTEDQRRQRTIGVEDLSKPVTDSRTWSPPSKTPSETPAADAEAGFERNMDNLRNRIVGLLQHGFVRRSPSSLLCRTARQQQYRSDRYQRDAAGCRCNS